MIDKTFRCMGSHGLQERETNDYYATDPFAVKELLKVEKFTGPIWEPACGEGHISRTVEEFGYDVISSDLIDRGYGVGGIDFLKNCQIYDRDIITNPPYRHSDEFIIKSLDSITHGRKIAMLLKVTALEGQERYRAIYSKLNPCRIHIFSKRIQCGKNGEFRGSGAVAFAWYVWIKGYEGQTIIDWIATGREI